MYGTPALTIIRIVTGIEFNAEQNFSNAVHDKLTDHLFQTDLLSDEVPINVVDGLSTYQFSGRVEYHSA